MTEQELDQLRREKWRLNGNRVRTLDEARAFIESVGFCLMYPLRPTLLLPTFIGAWSGSGERLPTQQHAFADPRAKDATELMVRLLRDRSAYEANLFEENNAFLLATSIFPYFYALVGEHNPKQPPLRRRGPVGPASKISGLRGCHPSAGDRSLRWQLCSPLAGEGSSQCVAERARADVYPYREPIPPANRPSQSRAVRADC